MDDSTPDGSSGGTTIGDVAGNIDHALIAGRDIIGNLLVTGDHNQVFAGDYTRFADAYIKPHEVFGRVDLEHFTGREWLLAAVDAFLQDHDCGYFILEADAGLGKTTFMAWLVKQRNYVHHFSELAPGPEGVEPALKSLAAQLALAYKLKPEGVLPAAASRPDYLYDLLCQAAQQRRPGERVVLVVDALDQAGTPLNQNALGLPSSLPPGVYVIVSQRPTPVTLQIKASYTARVPYLLTAESDGNQSDMRQFLACAAAWPGIAQVIQANGYIPDQFVAALLAKSRGLWIYLHYAVAQMELNAKGKGAGHLDLRLDRLPDGLTQYYIRYWQSWRDADEDKWYNIYLPLLATLAAAQEAVPLDRLLAWAGVTAAPPGLSRLFSERWRPFLVTIGQGQSARYRFYHATLPEFFAGQSDQDALTTAEQSLVAELAEATRAAHERLAERYLQAWGGLDTGLLGLQDEDKRDLDDRYGLRHLATHMAAAGRADDLHLLLQSEWLHSEYNPQLAGEHSDAGQSMGKPHVGPYTGHLNAWYTVMELVGRTDGYQADVTLAWHLAELQASKQILSTIHACPENANTQPNAIAMQCRYALITASLNSLAQNIGPELLGELVKRQLLLPQQGLAYARQVPDLNQRSQALATLAPYFLAKEQERVLEEALHTAKSIGSSTNRDRALGTIAGRMAELGWKQEALSTARCISDSADQAGTLAFVAEQLASNEREKVMQEALRTAQSIKDDSARARTFAALAPRLSADEQPIILQEALRAARRILRFGPSDQAPALRDLTRSMAEIGQLQEAFDVAQSIEDSATQAQALAIVGHHRAKHGEIRDALRIIRGIEDGAERAVALAAVAPYLTAGEKEVVLQESLRTAQGIEDSARRAFALTAVAPHLSTGEREKALQESLCTVQSISSSFTRADALAALGSHLSSSQLQEALRIAQRIDDPADRARAVASLAPYLSSAQLRVVHRISQSIEDSAGRARALASLAPHLGVDEQKKLLQDALDAAWSSVDSADRVDILASIACQLAELGQASEALKLVYSVEDSAYRIWALVALTRRMAELGQVQEALLTAHNITDTSDRASVLISIAQYVTASEQKEVLQETLRISQKIQNSDTRVLTLTSLARIMAELGSVQDALSTIQSIEYSADRAVTLSKVAPYLAPEQIQDALDVVRTFKNSDYLAAALAALASRMAEIGDLQQAFHIARRPEYGDSRAQIINAVAPYLSSEQLKEALTIVESAADNIDRARTLITLACRSAELGRLHDALRIAQTIDYGYLRSKALTAVAPYLTIAHMQAALHLVAKEEDSFDRAMAFAALAGRMAEMGQLSEALYTAQSIEIYAYARAQAFANLAPYLSAPQLQDALRIVQSLNDTSDRARILAALASHVIDNDREELIQQALVAVKSLTSGSTRDEILNSMASHFTADQLVEALAIPGGIEDSYFRAKVFAAVVPKLIRLPLDELHMAWSKLLRVLSSRKRSDLLVELLSTLDIIARIGGRTAVADTAEAIQNVGAWWP